MACESCNRSYHKSRKPDTSYQVFLEIDGETTEYPSLLAALKDNKRLHGDKGKVYSIT